MEKVIIDSPFLTFFLLMGVLTTIKFIWQRLTRSIMVFKHGWPPEHLDADGDWKPEPKPDDVAAAIKRTQSMWEAVSNKSPQDETAMAIVLRAARTPPAEVQPVSKYLRIGDFEVYDRDIGVMTYNDAVKAVEKIGDGWRIPTLEELRIMYKNKDNTYCTTSSGSDCPDWYWSSTPYRGYTDFVVNVRFSDGLENWCTKDHFRLSCRPMRLLDARTP